MSSACQVLRCNFDFTFLRRFEIIQRSQTQTQIAKQIFTFPKAQYFPPLSMNWTCLCVGAAIFLRSPTAWAVDISLSKSFSHASSMKQLTPTLIEILVWDWKHVCWDWVELLLWNCVWQEWISTEFQNIPDFMASLSNGVLINGFYLGDVFYRLTRG